MAPSIHPPCTPSASCTPIRCHPTPPPCTRPEQCLKKTTSKGIKPCRSAVSIMATKCKSSCGSCSAKAKKSKTEVNKFLKRKSKEGKMKKKDRIKGTNSYMKYHRKKGTKRSLQSCCAGSGHRGRIRTKKRCVIL